MREHRVVIVGGGLSGLVAARALSRAGADVDVIEARERLGGRVLGAHAPGWPFPIELGPEFVHGRPEATLRLLEQAGIARVPLLDRHHWAGGRAREGALHEQPDLWTRVGDVLRRVDFGVPDMSARDFVERLMLEGEERDSFEVFVRGFHAAPLADVSIQSLARDIAGPGDERGSELGRLEGGHGRLVEWLSAELHAAPRCRVHLGSRARHVTWRRGHVAVDVQRGDKLRSIAGSALLVTVPVGVMGARASEGGLDFAPYLSQKREALWLAGMAQVTKVVLRFRERFWSSRVDGFEFLHAPKAPFVTFWRQSAGDAEQITAWAGAPPTGALRPSTGAVDAALLGFCELLDADPRLARAALLGAHYHDYEQDPFARGAYSYVRPGGARARALLAEPIDATLFFAGEATDLAAPGTVEGAICSGERAAREVSSV